MSARTTDLPAEVITQTGTEDLEEGGDMCFTGEDLPPRPMSSASPDLRADRFQVHNPTTALAISIHFAYGWIQAMNSSALIWHVQGLRSSKASHLSPKSGRGTGLLTGSDVVALDRQTSRIFQIFAFSL